MMIQGASMEPSFHNFQIVLLDKHGKEYSSGNVIAFRCEGLRAVLVKRIAAEPGDTVQIEEGILKVNDEVTPWYGETMFETAGFLEAPVSLQEDEYIVIGDNIAESKDSRYAEVGIVRKETILGRVFGT